MNQQDSLSLNNKYNLTVSEAALYFNIGENKLRSMIAELTCNFVLHIGKKSLIKRKKLEKYLDEIIYL